MSDLSELTVKDHLHALEHDEPWMEDLAKMIIEFIRKEGLLIFPNL